MEVWSKIEGFPAYSVSNLGRVRRDIRGKGGQPAKILKNSRDRNGYAVVNLSRPDKSQSKQYVHALVAKTFLVRPEGATQVAHWDGDGMNAKLCNLRWANQSQNESDKHRHGRANYVPKGSRTFSACQIAEMQARIKSGASISAIAREKGVARLTVRHALAAGPLDS